MNNINKFRKRVFIKSKTTYYFTSGMLAIVIVDLVQVLHTNRLILPMCKKPQKFLYLLFSHQCLCCWNRKRVFILGPSHHVRLSGCALSSVAKYRTPFYDLTIDTQGKQNHCHNFIIKNTQSLLFLVYKELQGTGCFEWMNLETDEDEHSIEMHLPYIAKVFEKYVSLLYSDLYTYKFVLAYSFSNPFLFLKSQRFFHCPNISWVAVSGTRNPIRETPFQISRRPQQLFRGFIGFLPLGSTISLHPLR